MNLSGYISLLLSIVAAVVAVGGFLINRRKVKADVESIYEQMNTRQALKIKELEDDLAVVKEVQKGLQRALNERDEYIIVLLDGNGKLSKQLRDCDQTPCWEPPKPDFLYKLNGSRVNGSAR